MLSGRLIQQSEDAIYLTDVGNPIENYNLTSVSSQAIPAPSDVQAGDLLILNFQAGGADSSVLVEAGSTWTQALIHSANYQHIYYRVATADANDVATMTATPNGTPASMIFIQMAGFRPRDGGTLAYRSKAMDGVGVDGSQSANIYGAAADGWPSGNLNTDGDIGNPSIVIHQAKRANQVQGTTPYANTITSVPYGNTLLGKGTGQHISGITYNLLAIWSYQFQDAGAPSTESDEQIPYDPHVSTNHCSGMNTRWDVS